MFIRSLRHRYIGYANVTTLQILTHLYSTYAHINTGDLEANTARMKERYDVNFPIENFFDQIEDAMEYAAAGNAPFSPDQVVNTAFHVIFTTGMFHDDCKLWKRRPALERTWANFKIAFSMAHQELLESTQTAQSSGFQVNHMADGVQQETITAISHLANATMADRESMATLTATVGRLTVELAETNAKLVRALADNNILARQVGTSGSPARPGGQFISRDPSPPKPQYINYCHTHGIKSSHTSKDCQSPSATHNVNATEANKLGGRTTKWPTGRRE